ncbi:trihelix transcription factor ASIL2 [Ipomoea triloba]|uniref:trihelix transcription factor ASIL2 n=1 Tax=Ipomoea triloba TaxID=35885 RepID=UPI00125D34D8|nr:trihelix transcription factor ASIL2 [Ipomoea triloba]XP_031107576.1 trihelix transcription factor ASIL2 [Ipomoea triloba]
MDDSDDEGRYSQKPTSVYSFSSRSRRPIRNPSSYPKDTHYSRYKNEYECDDTEESDEGEDDPEFNGGAENGYDFRNKKKRKMESLVSNYEFAPRAVGNLQGTTRGGGSSRGAWSEEESFVLLDVWGERYLELGRRSLRGEDWVDVAEKVSEMIGVEKSEVDCRNQLDVLKKKYKKEREKMEKMGGGFSSKWPFFKKMDVLMNLRMKGHCGLGCGVDSGEYVFMDPRMYLDRSNVMDEMRDSPAGSDVDNEDEQEETEGEAGWEEDEESAKLLAESIQRFGDIYEKIENSKRKQMMELEKMKWEFQRELEMQKKQIIERAQAEIAKIRDTEDSGGDDDEDDEEEENNNVSAEKLNG